MSDTNMDNPYAAGELTEELVAEERQRPKLWKSLVIAYAVHHLFSVLGLLVGLLFKPSAWRYIFPPDNAFEALFSVVLIPVSDLLIVLEPPVLYLAGGGVFPFWHWLRIPLALSIPIAGFMYAKSRRRDWLWYVAIVSVGVYASFVLWFDIRPMGR